MSDPNWGFTEDDNGDEFIATGLILLIAIILLIVGAVGFFIWWAVA